MFSGVRMNFFLRGFITTLLLVIFTIIHNCASYSTFQSVEVLEPKEKALGFGFPGIFVPDEEIMAFTVELFGRYGINEKWDIGSKISGLPGYFGTFSADAKYQILTDPLFVSAGLGLSYTSVVELSNTHPSGLQHDKKEAVWGLHPMILAGNKNFYGGFKYLHFSNLGFLDLINISSSGKYEASIPGIVIGASIGDKNKVFPELNIYFPPGDNSEHFMIWGIGFQFAISR
jgi:hypothetical protein